MIPATPEEARAAGRAAAEGPVPLHDLAGHMAAIGIPQNLRGQWLCGLEDALEEQGVDTDPDSDGHAAERRALARIP